MPSNTEVVLATIRAVEQRDREALFGLYHDEVEFHDAASLPYGGVHRGKGDLREQLESRPEETWLAHGTRSSPRRRTGRWTQG